MTTVERLFEYTELPAEAPLESNKMHQPPSDWPSAGAIKAVNLALRYKSDGPIVLDHLSFSIEPCEKVSIANAGWWVQIFLDRCLIIEWIIYKFL